MIGPRAVVSPAHVVFTRPDDLALRIQDAVSRTANQDQRSYPAAVKGTASSIWHFAMTFVTDFEVHWNG
jgi:hypothetical protein